MSPYLQALMSDYLYDIPKPLASNTARAMLKVYGKMPDMDTVSALVGIIVDAAMGTLPPCRDEVIEALEREISNAEPRRRAVSSFRKGD